MAPSVLVVEDTQLLRRMYTDALAAEGYDVRSAGDGSEAVEMLGESPVDLVLLDLIMPKMGGLDALDAILLDPTTRDIPVIILSNIGHESDVERALQMGAAGYLVKNEAKMPDILAEVRRILARG